jgi:UDP-N-acetylglucosamine 2-epimerase (non-hydrolysing)
MRILSVVGARPNFMKAAPIIRAVDRHNTNIAIDAGQSGSAYEAIDHILVHTGQHHDEFMSGSFFSDLKLPPPDIHLGIGSASQIVQTAEIMKKFETVLWEKRPDIVVVVGDVTSTLACALVTAKVSFDSIGSRPLIAHVEAGLRSFDRSMPEEINRILTDQISDLLFVTEPNGLQNLRSEGIPAERIHFVGNTMIDSLLTFKTRAESSFVLDELGLRANNGNNGDHNAIRRYALLTLHRPSNVDHRDSFLSILDGLEELARDCPIIFPVHPRTQKRLEEFGLASRLGVNGSTMQPARENSHNGRHGIILTPPMGYLDFLCLMMHASVVVTDSGGIQEETTCLGVPCVTVRENTERPITTEIGTNVLAGTSKDRISNAIRQQMGKKVSGSVPEKWDGQAAIRIVDVLTRIYGEKTLPEVFALGRSSQQQLMPMGTFD